MITIDIQDSRFESFGGNFTFNEARSVMLSITATMNKVVFENVYWNIGGESQLRLQGSGEIEFRDSRLEVATDSPIAIRFDQNVHSLFKGTTFIRGVGSDGGVHLQGPVVINGSAEFFGISSCSPVQIGNISVSDHSYLEVKGYSAPECAQEQNATIFFSGSLDLGLSSVLTLSATGVPE